jgi:hypothetical protein
VAFLTYANAKVGMLVKWYAIFEKKWLIGIVLGEYNNEMRDENDDIVWSARGIQLYMEGQILFIDLDVDQDIYIMEEE